MVLALVTKVQTGTLVIQTSFEVKFSERAQDYYVVTAALGLHPFKVNVVQDHSKWLCLSLFSIITEIFSLAIALHGKVLHFYCLFDLGLFILSQIFLFYHLLSVRFVFVIVCERE